MWLKWSCRNQFLHSCVLAGSSLRLSTKVKSPPAVSVICETMLPERVLMLFVSTVTSWVTPSVPKIILNEASVRRMVIMPLIVACPGGVALPWLTLTFPLLIHLPCPILRTLLLMCLLSVLQLLLMFLNARRLFPRLSLCPMILLKATTLATQSEGNRESADTVSATMKCYRCFGLHAIWQ